MQWVRMLCFMLLIVVAAETARAAETETMIADLGRSPELNKHARATLVRHGKEVMPALLQALDGYKYLTEDACLRSARILRVIREMGLDDAIPASVDILSFVQGQGANRDLLMNEALDYLYVYFRDVRARDAYYDLVKNRTSKWLSRDQDFVRLFIMQGVAAMAENNDPRVDDILAVLLKKLPYEPPRAPGEAGGRWTSTGWLGADGYTPQGCKTVTATYRTRTERGPACFYDPYYRERMLDEQSRYRIACLELAKDYGSKGLTPSLEPLLKARHRAERDLALVAIEAVNKKPVAVLEKLDKVVLVNGDILTGNVQNADFILVTPYARLTLKRKEIKTIETDAAHNRRIIELYAGDKLSGTIPEGEMKMVLKVGGEISLKMVEVESITFGR